MIPLSLGDVGRLAPGELRASPGAVDVRGVKIDSRRIEPGDLFVAVRGGAQFVDDAITRGAAAALVPHDAFAAMAALGREVRSRSSARVVGITGSTGKTSTKDILAALCAPHAVTIAAEASYNAELGVPLTLCRLEPATQICILELAMRGAGQIAELCEIARPHIGVITMIGPAHLELVGTVDDVARAKAELLQALPEDGIAIVPSGEKRLARLIPKHLDVRTFGTGGSAFVESFESAGEHARVRLDVRGTAVELEFNFTARHQATNALAALLAYEALGLPLEQAQRGAAEIAFSRWRGEEVPLPDGGLLVNDAYNANPISMRAAIDHLVERAGPRRRVAVLGDMAELGERSPEFHREIGNHASSAGVDVLVAVGPLAAHYLDGQVEIPVTHRAAGVAEALAALDEILQPGDCVLVKGSRAMGLEAISEALAGVAA